MRRFDGEPPYSWADTGAQPRPPGAPPPMPLRRIDPIWDPPTWGTQAQEVGVGDENEASYALDQPPTSASAPSDRVSDWLMRLALLLVACVAAYSLQSHSQRHYLPGVIANNQVQAISYDAGWPLTYAQVRVTTAPVPLGDVEPTPAFRFIQPRALAVDVLLLAVPFWLLLLGIWAVWQRIMAQFGPRRLWRRCLALAFAALPALLWLLGGLGLGIFLNFAGTETVPWHPYFSVVLAPFIPGFGLAAGLSSVLEVRQQLWPMDFGIFLLLLALPFTGLTACFYVFACLFGRGLRRLFGRRP